MYTFSDYFTNVSIEPNQTVPTGAVRCGSKLNVINGLKRKGYFHLCPRMDFLQTLHINNSLYTKYENVFIELDS